MMMWYPPGSAIRWAMQRRRLGGAFLPTSSGMLASPLVHVPTRSHGNSASPPPPPGGEEEHSQYEQGGFQQQDGAGGSSESSQQRDAKARYVNRRPNPNLFKQKPTYEFRFVAKVCRRRPSLRQYLVRDDFCRVDPGSVVMSTTMQSAFMRVYNSMDKGKIRMAIRNIAPILLYRNQERVPPTLNPTTSPRAFLGDDESPNLNAKKDELFTQKKVATSAYGTTTLVDEKAQSKLRWRIRMKLIRFQRKVAIANAAASRSVLYSEEDAVGYFLFRGPAVYSATIRVLYELMRQMPEFVPKTMLDFGAGTGSSIMAAKEMFDPSSQSVALKERGRSTMTFSSATKMWTAEGLVKDLKRVDKAFQGKRKARFLAVAALIQRGEMRVDDLPEDLRVEVMSVARAAAETAKVRQQEEKYNAQDRRYVDGRRWDQLDRRERIEEATNGAAEDDDAYLDTPGEPPAEEPAKGEQPWWERYIDSQMDSAEARAKRRLRPLQQIDAVEPSPGMMAIAVNVLQTEAPNVTWSRFLNPEDTLVEQQRDLVLSAFTLSEISTPEQRRATLLQLWKATRGVLVLIEHANPANFDLMMDARDTLLEMKDVGLWDWQPTIVGPCPHEKKCPIRYSSLGVNRKNMRVCKVEVPFKQTFVEQWIYQEKSLLSQESICYLIVARNQLVPDRALKRKAKLEQEEAAAAKAREEAQQKLYDASLSLKDVVFERLSEEALHRPGTDLVPPAARREEEKRLAEAEEQAAAGGASSTVPSNIIPTATTMAVGRDGHIEKHQRGQKADYLTVPFSIPLAQHKYNRPGYFNDVVAHGRPIGANEMTVVREEMLDMQKEIRRRASDYWRIVLRRPRCTGKVTAFFCTHEGDLVKAKVYRRLHNVALKAAMPHVSHQWQLIGGWRYLKSAKMGFMWPADVPVFGVSKYGLQDTPNTLLGMKGVSHLELAAMAYNDPMVDPQVRKGLSLSGLGDADNDNKATLGGGAADSNEDGDLETGHGTVAGADVKSVKGAQDRAASAIDRILGVDGSKKEETLKDFAARFDARTPISGQKWADAIKSSRRNMKLQAQLKPDRKF